MTATPAQNPGWGRGRLLAIVGSAALLAAGVLAFLISLALESLTGPGPAVPVTVHTSAPPSTGPVRRDEIAAAPMLQVDPTARSSGVPATAQSRALDVPPATAQGPSGVPTGYPRTPAGAVGQLAAIDTTVLTGMSLQHTRAVHQAWTLPGAPTVEQWVMTENVSAFLAAAGPSPVGLPPAVVAYPAAGQVKGTDGPDWVLACVLLRVDATIARSASIAYGHCERLQWTEGRWQIAPGAQPALAPSTWPGTEAATQAGWLTWSPAEQG